MMKLRSKKIIIRDDIDIDIDKKRNDDGDDDNNNIVNNVANNEEHTGISVSVACAAVDDCSLEVDEQTGIHYYVMDITDCPISEIYNTSIEQHNSYRIGTYALLVGVLLVLYTPAWLILVWTMKPTTIEMAEQLSITQLLSIAVTSLFSAPSSSKLLPSSEEEKQIVSILDWLFRMFTYCILQFIPWITNAIFTIFVGGIMIYLGYLDISGKE